MNESDFWMLASKVFEYERRHSRCGVWREIAQGVVNFVEGRRKWCFFAGAEDGYHVRGRTEIEEREEIYYETHAGVVLQREIGFNTFDRLCSRQISYRPSKFGFLERNANPFFLPA